MKLFEPLSVACVLASFLLPIPSTQAIDCPALRITDVPTMVQGSEIISNTAPLAFAARLHWENPVDYTTTRVHIYRKEFGQPFLKIGQVSGSTTYLDKTIQKDIPAYTYVLKAEYTCGGTQWSEPFTVSTDRRMGDTTPPVIQVITPKNNAPIGKNDSSYIYVRDTESGIDERTISVKQGSKTIAAGKNLGTAQHALFKMSTSSIAGTDPIVVSIKNGAELEGKRAALIITEQADPQVNLSGPAVGDLIDLRKPLQLSWTITGVAEPSSDKVRLSYSTNFGGNWLPIEDLEIEASTGTIQNPSSQFLGAASAGIIWLRLDYSDGSRQFSSSILPVFTQQTKIQFVANGSTVPIGGEITVADAFTGKVQTFPQDTPQLKEKSTSIFLTENNQVELSLKPGFYSLEDTFENFVLPPGSPQLSALSVQPGSSYFPYTALPYASFFNNREPVSSLGIDIISGYIEEPKLFEIHQLYKQKEVVKEVAPAPLPEVTPEVVQLRTYQCDIEAQCRTENYQGLSPLRLSWDESIEAFAGSIGTGRSLATSPIFLNSFALEALSISLHIPDALMQNIVWNTTEEFTVTATPSGSLQWSLPERFIKVIAGMEGFLKVSMPLTNGQTCTSVLFQRRDVQGNMVPIPTLCAPGRVVGILLPFADTEISFKQVNYSFNILSGDDWYVPYMNQFQLWGMLYNQDDLIRPGTAITRGELAYLLHKAFQYPNGAYESTSQPYEDLPTNHPFAPYILGMVAQRIMSGDDGIRTLRPDSTINRAEALKMILTAAHLDDESLPDHLFTGENLTYVDISPDSWYAPYIRRATTLQLINGSMDGPNRVFRPGANVNRAEALKILFMALQKKALQ